MQFDRIKGWISVEEDLPMGEGELLVYVPSEDLLTLATFRADGKWQAQNGNLIDVSHWKSLLWGDEDERQFVRGQRAVWVSLLSQSLKELGYEITSQSLVGSLIKEREQAIQTLRQACDEFGDNEWSENLHLSDIISKHLTNHLEN